MTNPTLSVIALLAFSAPAFGEKLSTPQLQQEMDVPVAGTCPEDRPHRVYIKGDDSMTGTCAPNLLCADGNHCSLIIANECVPYILIPNKILCLSDERFLDLQFRLNRLSK